MKSTPIKAVRQKIKKLRKDLIGLENMGSYGCFQSTRLRTVSGLCKDEDDLCHFAFYIANKVAERILEKEDEKIVVKTLTARAMEVMSLYLSNPSSENRKVISDLHYDLKAYQNKTRKVGWTRVRTIQHWDLHLIEVCVSCFLYKNDEKKGYELARTYCEKYNPSRGTGLIPESIPFVRDVVEFWEGWYMKR